jgi:hypothetical protein
MKELLFSVTEKDLTIQTFHAGGPGGQNQNKTSSGVRIIHKESGAVGEARDTRSQLENKRAALKRMTETKTFKLWVNRVCAEIDTGETIDQRVDKMMKSENIKEEINIEGKWVAA